MNFEVLLKSSWSAFCNYPHPTFVILRPDLSTLSSTPLKWNSFFESISVQVTFSTVLCLLVCLSNFLEFQFYSINTEERKISKKKIKRLTGEILYLMKERQLIMPRTIAGYMRLNKIIRSASKQKLNKFMRNTLRLKNCRTQMYQVYIKSLKEKHDR